MSWDVSVWINFSFVCMHRVTAKFGSRTFLSPCMCLDFSGFMFPFSDRNAMGKFSSLFFSKTDQQLPFTDSDGLYDFPSSDGKGGSSATQHRKSSTGRRRERKSSRAGEATFKTSISHLDKNQFLQRLEFPTVCGLGF